MKKILIIICLIAFSINAHAVTVTGISSSAVHGTTITITGSAFGAKSPAAPVLWLDGESGTTDATVSASGNIVNAEPSLVTENSGYSNLRYRAANHRNVSAPHSYSTKYIAGCHDDEGECLGGEVGQNVGLTISNGTTSDRWYVHHYLRLDPLWPKNGSENYKFYNWETDPPYTMYSGTGMANYDNVTACTGGYNNLRRCPACDDNWMSGEIHLALNQTTCNMSTNEGYPVVTHSQNTPNPAKQWVAAEAIFYNKASGQDVFKLRHNNVALVDSELDIQGDCTIGLSAVGGVTIGGFWRDDFCGDLQDDLDDNACRFFDDIYVDNTLSRVMICNNATYASATICEPQIPTVWDSGGGSITVTVNRGALSTGANYLFVFDSTNAANATGFEVNIVDGVKAVQGGVTLTGSGVSLQ